ncbi:MAG: hypothetical protein WC679_02660 [Bacteroidales bacterium]|jgi:hypothetical protein
MKLAQLKYDTWLSIQAIQPSLSQDVQYTDSEIVTVINSLTETNLKLLKNSIDLLSNPNQDDDLELAQHAVDTFFENVKFAANMLKA